MLKHIATEAAPFIPIVLAQSSGGFTGNQLLVWLGCLAFVVMIYNQLAEARRNATTNLVQKPPSEELASFIAQCPLRHDSVQKELRERKEAQEKISDGLENLKSQVTEVERRLQKSDEARTSGLHKRLNKLSGGMREFVGALNGHLKLGINIGSFDDDEE
jgi:hypothetical protein